MDQLGRSKYFSTLDLASGYWQVPVHPTSRKKTAFITHQGLYEFQVMPFGLKNAPAVFQRLMQWVLHGLNPEEGPDFVSVYLDDVLVFSETLEEHLGHSFDWELLDSNSNHQSVVSSGRRLSTWDMYSHTVVSSPTLNV